VKRILALELAEGHELTATRWQRVTGVGDAVRRLRGGRDGTRGACRAGRRSVERRRSERGRAGRRGSRRRRRARRGARGRRLHHLHRPRHLKREQAQQENAPHCEHHLLPFGFRFGVELLLCHQLVPPVEPVAAVADGVVVAGVVAEGVVVVAVDVVPEVPDVAWVWVCGGALTVVPVP